VAESILDGYTTQTMVNRPGFQEHDPLARPFVTHGVAGQTAACALGIGIVIGVQYTLHRTGHPKAATWVGRLFVAGEGANVVHQFYLLR